jgi:hypothetical protein
MPATHGTALHRFIERFGVPDGRRVRLPAGAQVRVEYTERSVGVKASSNSKGVNLPRGRCRRRRL